MIARKFLPFRPTAAAAASALRPHHHHRLRCYSNSSSGDSNSDSNSDAKPPSEDTKILETATAAATATAKLEAAQTAIGYRFRKLELLQEALQAAGSGLGPPFVPGGNKQLALVGDRLLSFRLALLGRELGERTEQITYRIDTLAGNQHLHDVCDASGLTPCIQNNPSQKAMLGVKTKTATVEAVIAAVYYDGGMQAAEAAIRHLNILQGAPGLD